MEEINRFLHFLVCVCELEKTGAGWWWCGVEPGQLSRAALPITTEAGWPQPSTVQCAQWPVFSTQRIECRLQAARASTRVIITFQVSA